MPAFDICVVGGAGHVGAPLAIVLADCGFRVLIHDIDRAAVDRLAAGELPFKENGAEELLRRNLQAGRLDCTTGHAGVKGVPTLILTVTAVGADFGDPSTSLLLDCINGLLPHLSDGVCIIVRSTVTPGFTDFLDGYLRERGKTVLLAYCPERVAEGRAVDELRTIPQLVGGCSSGAVERARAIFGRVASEIVEMSPLEAEYAKLICNAYRYVQFAVTNELSTIVESAGIDYHRLLAKTKQGYPRMAGMPRAGFAAGPCLMKDAMHLFASSNHGFTLGPVAMTINEGMPDHIVARLAERLVLEGRRVGILGMAFKAESDDPRGSLSYALGQLLRLRGAEVSYSDEYIADASFVSKERLIESSDVVIIAAPHNAYKHLQIPKAKVLVDICGSLETGHA